MSAINLSGQARVAPAQAASRAAPARHAPKVQGTGEALSRQLKDGFEEISANASSLRNRDLQTRQKDREPGKVPATAGQFGESTLTDDAPARIEELLAVARRGRGDAKALLAYAESLFSDPSDVALALVELRTGSTASAEVKAMAAQAEALNERRHTPKKVRAGMHATATARATATRAVNASALRDTYRLLVAGETRATDFYGYIVDTFGAAHRVKVMTFLEDTCAVDKHACNPSCTTREFGEIDASLGTLRLLRSVDTVFCEKLRTAFGERLESAEVSRRAIDVLRAAIDCTDGDIGTIVAFRQSVLYFAGSEESARGATELYAAFAALPEAIFVDATARAALLDNLRAWRIGADAATISPTARHFAPAGTAAPHTRASLGVTFTGDGHVA